MSGLRSSAGLRSVRLALSPVNGALLFSPANSSPGGRRRAVPSPGGDQSPLHTRPDILQFNKIIRIPDTLPIYGKN
jgi:hypothetical protein